MNKLVKLTCLAVIYLSALPAPAIGAEEAIQIPFSLGKGQLLYEKYCSSCHGARLEGSDNGPPLVHPFYKPSHHGDEAFYRAALRGVRQHHWNFGDMAPVQGMTRKKMDSLLPYLRYYQQQMKLY